MFSNISCYIVGMEFFTIVVLRRQETAKLAASVLILLYPESLITFKRTLINVR